MPPPALHSTNAPQCVSSKLSPRQQHPDTNLRTSRTVSSSTATESLTAAAPPSREAARQTALRVLLHENATKRMIAAAQEQVLLLSLALALSFCISFSLYI